MIDMGTNTFHLLIASVGSEGIKVLHKEKKAVKLGEGGISSGVIAPEAMIRAITTIAEFYAVCGRLCVQNIFATATSAVRSAKNKDELLEKIKGSTGISVRVISGELEAELIYEGVKQSMDLGENISLIMDIGGGSVEFILANRNQLFWKGSFEIGGQRLIDAFHQQDPMQMSQIEQEKEYLSLKLAPLFVACETFPPTSLVGASGSFDTLASIDILNKKLDVNIEQATEYGLAEVDFYRIFNFLKPLNKAQRLVVPGMLDLRAEMIVVAGVLIELILQRVPSPIIRVSTFALKEGVLARLAEGRPIS